MSQNTTKEANRKETVAKEAPVKDTPIGKYGALIQKAKTAPENQNTEEPANQNAGLPEPKEEEVNLSIKVPKRWRRHWASEAKRQDTTLTAVIIAALKEKFGESPRE